MKPDRFHRLKAVLDRRQPDLTVLMENVHKGHNFAAVLRSCDAVGMLSAHAVLPTGHLPSHRRMSAAGAKRWIEVHTHTRLEQGVEVVRGRGMQLLAAHLSPRAVDYREVDYTQPTAILLGQEKDGVTQEAIESCDGEIVIPMEGMVGSLNVSVAAAVILFEAQRQRSQAGLYETQRLEESNYQRILFEWAYPRLASLCQRRGEPYPPLGPDGELLGPVPR
ncbi:MAG: tRNA (guanosine(18)-2'-O)-methyltransferase TrmH [Deltaproteobacteria bacterium]|nr:tRNA (guanosine(18)-2'-O)-methyltransferase TrmH [Deltaproteobacteria bacterium]